MRLDPSEPAIVLQVEIIGESGTRLVDMALDTGASYLMVPWSVATALGYDPSASLQSIDLTTVSSVEVAPVIELRRVRVLGAEASNVEAVCHDLPPGTRVEGLLGLSFLKHFDVDLHFKRGVLEIRP